MVHPRSIEPSKNSIFVSSPPHGLPRRLPGGIETSADGNSVYVVNWFSNEVWTINTETLKVTAKIPAGDGPRAFGTFLREML